MNDECAFHEGVIQESSSSSSSSSCGEGTEGTKGTEVTPSEDREPGCDDDRGTELGTDPARWPDDALESLAEHERRGRRRAGAMEMVMKEWRGGS